MTVIQENLHSEEATTLMADFEKQRSSYLANPVPDYDQRKQDLLNLKRMINENRDAIIAAISADIATAPDTRPNSPKSSR